MLGVANGLDEFDIQLKELHSNYFLLLLSISESIQEKLLNHNYHLVIGKEGRIRWSICVSGAEIFELRLAGHDKIARR